AVAPQVVGEHPGELALVLDDQHRPRRHLGLPPPCIMPRAQIGAPQPRASPARTGPGRRPARGPFGPPSGRPRRGAGRAPPLVAGNGRAAHRPTRAPLGLPGLPGRLRLQRPLHGLELLEGDVAPREAGAGDLERLVLAPVVPVPRAAPPARPTGPLAVAARAGAVAPASPHQGLDHPEDEEEEQDHADEVQEPKPEAEAGTVSETVDHHLPPSAEPGSPALGHTARLWPRP